MVIRVGAGVRCLGSIPSYPLPTGGPWENGENVVKLEAIDPMMTHWETGKARSVGCWSYVDTTLGDRPIRRVFHHHTEMLRFEWQSSTTDHGTTWSRWEVVPVSVGWGSVSDQQGTNKMMRGYGWRYVRANGARYEKIGS